ncbi:hypothetical protein L6452_09927 [Arctium lappa]|uniref:Uncharacterized protein n=1 Tax=Arctium lappa TaxID=4217 RepID=A0ACB9DLU9_ARCLA|nr:hypothetical protein L6452_09927 [Arctium lappa]
MRCVAYEPTTLKRPMNSWIEVDVDFGQRNLLVRRLDLRDLALRRMQLETKQTFVRVLRGLTRTQINIVSGLLISKTLIVLDPPVHISNRSSPFSGRLNQRKGDCLCFSDLTTTPNPNLKFNLITYLAGLSGKHSTSAHSQPHSVSNRIIEVQNATECASPDYTISSPARPAKP